MFGAQPTRLDLYEAEQAIADEVSIRILADVADGALGLDDLLTNTFLRNLHRQLYEELWTWAGTHRTRKLSIGIDPLRIAVEFRAAFDTLRYRWEHTDDWTPRELGIAVHAETLRIHGFVDGSERATRLLADLVFFAAQDPEAIIEVYDWDIDKSEYIALPRQHDVSRDPKPLAAFIPVRSIDDESVD